MNITSLLNPEIDDHPMFRSRRKSSARLRFTRHSTSDNIDARGNSFDSLSDVPIKRLKYKEAKDAPKFEKGDPKGEILYPPFEPGIEDSELVRQYKKFSIYPKGDISLYPRHIPYASDKKSFLARTGKAGFEVFQYTFRDSKGQEWTVMWDYNDGLVRITPFFKCLNYGKTIPAKAIAASPGLKELCHSVTGGALAAQGYWMPFQAAKALASTFCWEIRYALTPLFGPDFVAQCTRPDDPIFKRYEISPSVVQACAATRLSGTKVGKHGNGNGNNASRRTSSTIVHSKQRKRMPTLSSSSLSSSSLSQVLEPPRKKEVEVAAPRSLRTRRASASVHTPSFSDSNVDADITPSTSSQEAVTPPSTSPPSSSSASWRAVNNRLLEVRHHETSPVLSADSGMSTKRPWSDVDDGGSSGSSGVVGETMKDVRVFKKRKAGMFEADEARAAYMLLQLSVADRASVRR